jgi:signal transduction histidine kinase
VIAHEVKNPLAGIRGAIQVIAGRMPPESKETQIMKEVVARIDALNDLVEDMLLFARPPRPKPITVDVALLVGTTAQLLRDDPTFAQVETSIEGGGAHVLADPELLKIVFVNLLLNAAQAMRGGGNVRISVRASDGRGIIMVADSGPGIPAEVQEKLFLPFFTTKSRGTGLGLATAKRLIEAHNGSIEIACPPGGGTVVTVQLPAALVDSAE